MDVTDRTFEGTLPARRAAGGFTMLEVMLAVILGAMVLTTALGVFTALQRTSRRNEERLQTAMELAQAHRAVELALRTMILSDTRAPVPAAASIPGQPAPATPPAPDPADETFARPRVILSRDESLPPMYWVDGQGRTVKLDAQRLEITIERPPVFAEPGPGETYTPNVRRVYASRHQRDRDRRLEERRADREEPGDELEENPYDDTEPAIAAGVRGVFALRWDEDRPRPGELPKPEGGSWSLWWRTLPPIVDVPGMERIEGLSNEELERNPMYRPVLLASNLRWCKWEAVRAGETLTEFTSTWWEDLPAYVTLEIQTYTGKWSKWMFEVQGTRGKEPGTPLDGARTPGRNDTPPDAEGAQLQGDPAALLEGLNSGAGPGKTGTGTQRGRRSGSPGRGNR